MFIKSDQCDNSETHTDDISDDLVINFDDNSDDHVDAKVDYLWLELDAPGGDPVSSIPKCPPRQPRPVLPADLPVQGDGSDEDCSLDES